MVGDLPRPARPGRRGGAREAQGQARLARRPLLRDGLHRRARLGRASIQYQMERPQASNLREEAASRILVESRWNLNCDAPALYQ